MKAVPQPGNNKGMKVGFDPELEGMIKTLNGYQNKLQ